MKFGRDAVVERVAIATYLNDIRAKLLHRGESDPYAAFAAGVVRGLVASIVDDKAHMDLLEPVAAIELTQADVVQRLFDVTLKGTDDIN